MDLVYLPDRSTRYAEVDNTTMTAKILTNRRGDVYPQPVMKKITTEQIVSNLPQLQDIEPVMYYVGSEIRAKSFVIKNNVDNPLFRTSRSGLGSGIYGFYERDTAVIENIEEAVFKIDFVNPYILQDIAHKDSMINASLFTNRYLDKILQTARFDKLPDLSDLSETTDLINLWNIVLQRTAEAINAEFLDPLLISYIDQYLNNHDLKDSYGNEIEELPINY